jgi:ABC-type molybdate transport system substrate-binding protein
MRLKTNLVVAVACVLWPLSSFANVTPLKVAVVGGFSPTFKSLTPSLTKQLQQPIEVITLPNATIRTQLKQAKFDLIITGAPNQLSELDYVDQLQPNTLTVIAHSPIILWCPNPNIQMRVRVSDTLKNKNIKTLAISPVGSPVGDLVREQLRLPAHIQLKPAIHALHAWQLAQQSQVDCAFTMSALARPNDQYQFLPHRGIKIIAAIPKTSGNNSGAAKLLKLLDRPLFRARIQHYGYS